MKNGYIKYGMKIIIEYNYKRYYGVSVQLEAEPSCIMNILNKYQLQQDLKYEFNCNDRSALYHQIN